MANTDSGTVLVVDDEPAVAEAYGLWLADDYDVRVATDGQEALEEMDEQIDVVLLDRRMPRLSGDEALEELRDRGYDCQIAMVTAVDPGFDIVEMEFDDYLTKPVTREEVEQTVDSLVELSACEETITEEFRLARKQAALESEKSERELLNEEQYRELRRRREELREEADEPLEEMDAEALRAMLESLREEREE